MIQQIWKDCEKIQKWWRGFVWKMKTHVKQCNRVVIHALQNLMTRLWWVLSVWLVSELTPDNLELTCAVIPSCLQLSSSCMPAKHLYSTVPNTWMSLCLLKCGLSGWLPRFCLNVLNYDFLILKPLLLIRQRNILYQVIKFIYSVLQSCLMFFWGGLLAAYHCLAFFKIQSDSLFKWGI